MTDTVEIGRFDCPGLGGDREALLQQRLQLLLAHALAPARQRAAVQDEFVLEELLAAEELVIGVLHPALAQHLVGEVVGVLEDCLRIASPAISRVGNSGGRLGLSS